MWKLDIVGTDFAAMTGLRGNCRTTGRIWITMDRKTSYLKQIKEIKQAKNGRILGFFIGIYLYRSGSIGWELQGAKNYVRAIPPCFVIKKIDWKCWMHSNITTKGKYHEESLSRFGKISLLLALMYFVVSFDDDKEKMWLRSLCNE